MPVDEQKGKRELGSALVSEEQGKKRIVTQKV